MDETFTNSPGGRGFNSPPKWSSDGGLFWFRTDRKAFWIIARIEDWTLQEGADSVPMGVCRGGGPRRGTLHSIYVLTKREMQKRIDLLREQLRDNEELMRKAAAGVQRMRLALKADLARGLNGLREAQDYIRIIRARSAGDLQIRKIMMALGFGTVTPSQFMKAKTMEDVFVLLDQKSSLKLIRGLAGQRGGAPRPVQ
jgi:hypothetical protein